MDEERTILLMIEPDKPARLCRLTKDEISAEIGGIAREITLTQTNDVGSVVKLLLPDQADNPLCRVLTLNGCKYPVYGKFAVVRENIYGELTCIRDIPLPIYRQLDAPITGPARKGVAACG